MTLRWLTAGESHGPFPGRDPRGAARARLGDLRRHPRRTGTPPARLRPRRADEVRAGRGHDHRRRPARRDPGRTGRHRDRQHRVAQVGEGHVGRPRRPGAARGARRATRPSPALGRVTPTSSGMQKYDFDEARPDPRARLRPGDRGPGGPRPRRLQLPRAGGRRPDRLPRHRARRRTRPRRLWPAPATTSARLDDDPVRCLDPEPASRWSSAIDQAHKDGDTLGGVVEVVVHGLPPGPRLARALGPAARLASGRRADGHPGDQGRRGRRRLRAGGHPGLAGARRDRRRPTRASDGSAAAPAAPRAG